MLYQLSYSASQTLLLQLGGCGYKPLKASNSPRLTEPYQQCNQAERKVWTKWTGQLSRPCVLTDISEQAGDRAKRGPKLRNSIYWEKWKIILYEWWTTHHTTALRMVERKCVIHNDQRLGSVVENVIQSVVESTWRWHLPLGCLSRHRYQTV